MREEEGGSEHLFIPKSAFGQDTLWLPVSLRVSA